MTTRARRLENKRRALTALMIFLMIVGGALALAILILA
jgi:type IV secretory pathway component VirB8